MNDIKNSFIPRMVVNMKKQNNASINIKKYIKDNQISIEQISKDTGIPVEKIIDEDVSFSATEFLEMCSYLNIRPEKMK